MSVINTHYVTGYTVTPVYVESGTTVTTGPVTSEPERCTQTQSLTEKTVKYRDVYCVTTVTTTFTR